MSTPRAPGRWRKVNGYRAFVPDSLPPSIAWSDTLVRALSDADRLVGRLAGEGGHLPNPHLFIRPFLRREAVLSSKIEGTQATLGELLAADAGAVVDRSPTTSAKWLITSRPWSTAFDGSSTCHCRCAWCASCTR